jgi:hypothetical protein
MIGPASTTASQAVTERAPAKPTVSSASGVTRVGLAAASFGK